MRVRLSPAAEVNFKKAVFYIPKGDVGIRKMKKLLVIDDNPSFCLLVKENFEDRYEVDALSVFSQIKDIILKIESFLPDVVLVDINLGKFSGVDVLREMKKNKNIANIPIIVLTASDYNITTESLVKSEKNVVAFYSKLESLDVIKEKINSIIPKE